MGHIGNERGRGFFVQTVLAVRPQTREVLGCMAQEPLVRTPAPQGEQRHQRRKRDERETDVWMRQVQAIGTPESASLWVHVGDRGADRFPFFQACRSTQLQLACGQLTLLPPRHEPRARKDPMSVWVIRVWQEQAPEGAEPKDRDLGDLGAHHDA